MPENPLPILADHPPALHRRRQEPTTGNQVACSAQAEAQIDHMAAADVGAGGAEVGCQFVRCADFLQSVGQDGQLVDEGLRAVGQLKSLEILNVNFTKVTKSPKPLR